MGPRGRAASQRSPGGTSPRWLLPCSAIPDPDTHAGATYDLTGPTALTLHEVAQVLSEVTGHPHAYVDETLDEARASRASYGAPDWLVDAWISTYTAIRDGELEAVSDDVPRLLGRPATSFAEAVAVL